jgi:hypothetical protein
MMDDIVDQTEYFEYLDRLRESGEINMFEGNRYLRDEFGLDAGVAMRILKEWMLSKTRDSQYEG